MASRAILESRLSDNPWTVALCHFIPLYSWIYAIRRRTISPLLCRWVFGFLALMLAGSVCEYTERGKEETSPAALTFFMVTVTGAGTAATAYGVKRSQKSAAREISEWEEDGFKVNAMEEN